MHHRRNHRRLAGSLSLALTLAPVLAAPASGQGAPRVQLRDVSAGAGIEGFNHFSYGFGGDGLAGAAWFDYNQDGLLDLYLTNGKTILDPDSDGFPNALFENQGGGRFVDVAALRGVTSGTGNSGVIAADIDNDGDQDLFLTGDGGMLGHDAISGIQTVDSGVALYLNDGPPAYRFTRLDPEAVGLGGLESTMSAAFADVDSDGLLDLLITAPGTRPEGCQPQLECDPEDPTIKLHSSRLYLNRPEDGSLSFQDVSGPSTIGASKNGALATVFSDFNRDGRIDLYVANGVVLIFQPTPLQLYLNLGYRDALASPVFRDITDTVNLQAQSAWMGVAAADFDGDLGTDFFITNAGGEREHALYHWSQAERQYKNVNALTRIAGTNPSPSDYFGWGCTAQDFDLDGRADLFLAGSPPPLEGASAWNPGTLLLNDPPVRFFDYSDATGVDLSERFTSGVAAADYDNDGRVDLAVATDNWNGDLGKPVLLRNETENDHRWLTVRLAGNGIDTNRDAVGARVAVISGDGPDRRIQLREIYAGSSFLSMDSKWLTFGLGALAADATALVAVDWPDGPQTPGDLANWTVYGPFAVDGFADITQE